MGFPISLPSAALGEVGKSATSAGLGAAGCSFGATEGDGMAASREWFLLRKLAPCGGGCAKILKWMLLPPTLDYAWHWMLADSHT